jgi:hypothetical protein
MPDPKFNITCDDENNDYNINKFIVNKTLLVLEPDYERSGVYGQVRKYKDKHGNFYVLKKFTGEFATRDFQKESKIINELNDLKKVTPDINNCVVNGWNYSDENDAVGKCPYIVMECLDGSLPDYFMKIKSYDEKDKQTIRKNIFVKVMTMMSTLIKHKIIYTDLKKDNVLYRNNNNETTDFKLGDFGSFYFYGFYNSKSETYEHNSPLGTPIFTHELFYKDPDTKENIILESIFQCIAFWWELTLTNNTLKQHKTRKTESSDFIFFKTQFINTFQGIAKTQSYDHLHDIFKNFATIASNCNSLDDYDWTNNENWVKSWSSIVQNYKANGGKHKKRAKRLSRKKVTIKKTKNRKKAYCKKSNKRKVKTKKHSY